MNIINFNNHSEFSLLGSLLRIENLVSFSAFYGFPACCLTDTLSTWGFYRLKSLCESQKIKAVYGLELFVRGIHGRGHYPVKLIAVHNPGLENLFHLNSLSHSAFRKTGRFSLPLDEIRKSGEGLAVLAEAEILHHLRSPELETTAVQVAERYLEAFPGRFYAEVNYSGEAKLDSLHLMTRFIGETGLTAISACETRYYLEDRNAFHFLNAYRQKIHPHDERGYPLDTKMDFTIRRPVDLSSAFKNHPEYLENTRKLLESIETSFGSIRYQIHESVKPKSVLWKTCIRKLSAGNFPKNYKKRLLYELSLIEKKGCQDWFLLVSEMVGWMKSNRIAVGFGKNGVSSSLTAFLLGITSIDPVKERLDPDLFLINPGHDYPVIDLEVGWRNKKRVLTHILSKYGHDKLARLGFLDRLLARSIVKDIGKVYHLPRETSSRLRTAMPPGSGATFSEILQNDPRFDALVQEDPESSAFLDVAQRIEGAPFRESAHPSAILFSMTGADKMATVETLPSGGKLVQMTVEDRDFMDFVKLEVSGQRFISVIRDALKMAGAPEPDFNDSETWELINSGQTTGIPALESSGIRELIHGIRPDRLSVLADAIALFRPYSIRTGIADEYARRRTQGVPVNLFPSVVNILKDTNGLLLYREQVYRIVRQAACFKREAALELLTVVQKKDNPGMVLMRESFKNGCLENSIPETEAGALYSLLTEHGAFSISRAVSLSTAYTAYIGCWLKTRFPKEFAVACLNNHTGNPGRLNLLISDIRYRCAITGISVDNICINQSKVLFSRSDGKIVPGLAFIRHTGIPISREIVRERRRNGPFRDLLDFCIRMKSTDLSQKTVEFLVKAGAFDCFGHERSALLSVLPSVFKLAAGAIDTGESLFAQENAPPSLGSLLSEVPATRSSDAAASYFRYEQEALGVFLSGHPLDAYRNYLKDLKRDMLENVASLNSGLFAGYLHHFRAIRTRKGSAMAIGQLSDETGTAACVFFPALYQKFSGILTEGAVLLVKGKVMDRKIQPEMVYLMAKDEA